MEQALAAFAPGDAARPPELKDDYLQRVALQLGVPWKSEIVEAASSADEPGSEKEGDSSGSKIVDGIEWRIVSERGFFMARASREHSPSRVFLNASDESKLVERGAEILGELSRFNGEFEATVHSLASEEHEKNRGVIEGSKVRVADRVHFTHLWNGVELIHHKAYLGFETDGSLSKVRFTYPNVFAVNPVRSDIDAEIVRRDLENALASTYLGNGDPARQLNLRPVWAMNNDVLRPGLEITGLAFAEEGSRWTSFTLFIDEEGGSSGLENR